ncbi:MULTISPECIES: type II toxin-antitoxin system YafQ family toxin [unclassified Levilactobacillus]|uniref:type II toxin-antitoxin system YafQ family toxin n=1 Tax=Lactobacillaceae TaxID=33958 RepID=UPI001456EC65|nr:type II toxin-antitoxin system YafQ family toxin [Lactobacillus sp. HBUAS51381]
MYKLKPEPQFKEDYRKLKRTSPELITDLMRALEQLQINGVVNQAYQPHRLKNQGGNYNGNYEFHLLDGKVDILVIYMPHKTNPVIRLVRMGRHDELFRGKLN